MTHVTPAEDRQHEPKEVTPLPGRQPQRTERSEQHEGRK